MAELTYSQYQERATKAPNTNGNSNIAKVGFFKLEENAEALVRINCATVNDLKFVTVHKPVFGKKFEGLSNPYAGISCLNEYGVHQDNCPLCKAAAKEGSVIAKAKPVVFIEMLVSYKDKVTGQYSAPVPMIWERPSGFSREIANMIGEYGSLKNELFKVTRAGSGTDTRYSFMYAMPTVYKPEMIPADFSAFENGFKINRHSYWEKTADEVNAFLTTGSFPEVAKTEVVDTPYAAPQAQATNVFANTATVEEPVFTPNFNTQPQQQAQPAQQRPQASKFNF